MEVRAAVAWEAGKPLTTLCLTPQGRDALAAHARKLLAALETPATVPAMQPASVVEEIDDWVD